MKKSQIEAQIFVYIMVIVIAGGVLIYGYTAISDFMSRGDNILFLQFENTMRNDLKSISFESTKTKTYELPTKVSQICFKTEGADANSVSSEETRTKKVYPLIKSTVAETQDNVFIYPKGEKHFYAGVNLNLGTTVINAQKIDIAFRCFDVKSGILSIRIKGLGSTVLIE